MTINFIYYIGNKLFQQNIKTNQNISTIDVRLAPTHKPIIPPIFEIRLILFQYLSVKFDDFKVQLTLRWTSPARSFCNKVP